MPEKRVSVEERKKLNDWLNNNAVLISRTMMKQAEGWVVGETKVPIIIDPVITGPEFLYPEDHSDKEADVYYPTVLASKLSESGVVFEGEKSPHQAIRSGSLGSQSTQVFNAADQD